VPGRSASMQGMTEPNTWTWDDLRYLLAVERHGSLAAAARSLKVDQTTVGRRLDALELAVGARLLERGAGGCRLTPAGLRACEAALTMEGAAADLSLQVAGQDSRIHGVVRLSAPGGFVPLLLQALAAVHAEHPQLVFELDANQGLVNVVQRQADIAIRMAPLSQPSLTVTRLGALPWGVFAAPAYLKRKPWCGVWDGHDVIAYEAPLDRSPGQRWLDAHATKSRVTLRTNNALAALQAASAGLGLAVAPQFFVQQFIPTEGALTCLTDAGAGAGESPVLLVTHPDVLRVPRVRATVDGLVRELRERGRLVAG
jgi:DNA-binding transcriptional LysR family regulator